MDNHNDVQNNNTLDGYSGNVQQTGPLETHDKKPKTRKVFVILSLLGVIFLLLCLFFGFLLLLGMKDAGKVQAIVSTYLQDISNEDIDEAYGLVSEEFKKKTPKEKLATARTDDKYIWGDFQSLKQTGFYIKKSTKGLTIYEYQGKINYSDGAQGNVSARLIKENNNYKLFYIEVFAPKSRCLKYHPKDKCDE